MADEEVTGTGEGQPADDIRSALASAIATSEETAATAAADAARAEPKPKEEKPAGETKPEGETAPETKVAAAKPVDKKEPPEEKPEGEAGTAAETKPADDKAAKAEADKTAKAALTGKWSAKDKETFAKLPAEGQDLILRRHKEMEAAFTRKTQEVAAQRKEYEPVDKLFEPWADKMKAAGFTKSSMIQAWANVEQRLMNPADAPNVIAGIIKGYRIDPGKILAALGFAPTEQRRAGGGELEAVKPNGDGTHIQLPAEVVEKLARLDHIEGRLNERDQRDLDAAQHTRREAETRVMSEIEAFKSAEDGKGNPLHPHFDEVESIMARLAAAAIAAKEPVPPLAELYETAVWANPSTRDAMNAAKDAAREAAAKAQREKADAEARAKAAAARKAGSSVTGAPGSGPAPRQGRATERSLREELEANAAEASAP
jgi:hypothetical protein